MDKNRLGIITERSSTAMTTPDGAPSVPQRGKRDTGETPALSGNTIPITIINTKRARLFLPRFCRSQTKTFFSDENFFFFQTKNFFAKQNFLIPYCIYQCVPYDFRSRRRPLLNIRVVVHY